MPCILPFFRIYYTLKFYQVEEALPVKDLSLLVFLTQLGLSVALPLAGFILLALWLYRDLGWGSWVIWAGVILGALTAFEGLRSTLKAMSQLSKKSDKQEPPAVSFNDHD